MKFMYEPAEVKEVDLHHLVTVSADQEVQEMPQWVIVAQTPQSWKPVLAEGYLRRLTSAEITFDIRLQLLRIIQ